MRGPDSHREEGLPDPTPADRGTRVTDAPAGFAIYLQTSPVAGLSQASEKKLQKNTGLIRDREETACRPGDSRSGRKWLAFG